MKGTVLIEAFLFLIACNLTFLLKEKRKQEFF